MNYAETFDKWMLWEENELNLVSLLKGKSSPPANKPPVPSNKDRNGQRIIQKRMKTKITHNKMVPLFWFILNLVMSKLG